MTLRHFQRWNRFPVCSNRLLARDNSIAHRSYDPSLMPWATLLATLDPTDDKRRSALALLWMTLLLGAILLVLSAWLLARWRRRVHGALPPRRRDAIADAWLEAGRRAEPITVDLDPPDPQEPPHEPPDAPPNTPPRDPRPPRSSGPAPHPPHHPPHRPLTPHPAPRPEQPE